MALTYYLSIDGIVGNSLREGYEGAFVVTDYDFDVRALVSAISGGAGTSKSTFSPLTVDLNIGSGLTDLLRNIAGGRHISSIELEGVLPDGTLAYDLKLGDVFVTELHDSNGGDSLAFTYQQVSLTTWSQDNTGQFNPVTVSWNIAANKEGVSIPDPDVTGAPHGSGGQDFYLTVDGIVGDSLSEHHAGAFEVSSYSFDVSALVSTISGGAGTSKSTFSPLLVALDLGSGQAALLKDIASGKHLSSIELKGDTADGTLAYDLKLGDVFVTTYHDTNSGLDHLAFTYQQVSLTTWSQDNTGQFNPVTVSWNIATNKEDVNIPDPLPNHSPIALDDVAIAGTGIGGTASGNVLDNDSDPDGDTLSVTPFSGAGAHGNLALSADGSFSYTVTNLTGATGSHLHDIFGYTEADGRGGMASASLDITLNRAPDVTSNIVGIKAGVTTVGNVLGNDSDTDADTLAITAVNGGTVGQGVAGTFGTLVLNNDGSYSYQSNNNVPGGSFSQDIFTFTESDGHGGSVQSTLTFSIIANGQTYLAGTPGQTISPANGKAVLDGGLGAQHLNGGNGADVLIGGPGDILAGGNGGDAFVFNGNFGHNEITDFKNPDVIELAKSAFGSIANVLAHAVNDGHGNTIITDPNNSTNSITIDHVAVNQLHESDFLLV